MSFDNVNVNVSGGQSIINALQNYTTIILKPNIIYNRNVLTQEMISKKHTKYIIKWNYSLEYATINVPKDCIIEFAGGTIDNGTIVGDNTILIYSRSIDEVCPAERQGTFIYNTTVADEDDITSESGQLKFKDRPTTYGMGRKILRKNIIKNVNILTQSMINQSNTIYVIQYDFTLNEDITIPDNCVLEFDGGSINGECTITGKNTRIKANLVKIFSKGIVISGTWYNSCAWGDWFEGTTDIELSNLLILGKGSSIRFNEPKRYELYNRIYIPSNTTVDFLNTSLIKKDNNAFICNASFLSSRNDTNIKIFNLSITHDNGIYENAIKFVGVKGAVFDNISIVNSNPHITNTSAWAITLWGMDIKLNNIYINNIISGTWSDGIHIIGGVNIEITNANIYSGDDCIAMHKQGSEDSIGYSPSYISNITVKNIICKSGANCIRIGCDNDIINQNDYYVSNVLIDNIKFEYTDVDAANINRWFLRIGDARTNVTTPSIYSNIIIKNINALCRCDNINPAINIWAVNNNVIFDDITFNNLTIVNNSGNPILRCTKHLNKLSFIDCNITDYNKKSFEFKGASLFMKNCIFTANIPANEICVPFDLYSNYLKKLESINCSFSNTGNGNGNVFVVGNTVDLEAIIIQNNDNNTFLNILQVTNTPGISKLYYFGNNKQLSSAIASIASEVTNFSNNEKEEINEGNFAQRPSNAKFGYIYFAKDIKQYIYFKGWADAFAIWCYFDGTCAVDFSGNNAKRIGATNERPTLPPFNTILGFCFFDITLNKPIYAKMINSSDGVVTWVDATGTTV